jgi:hypothetical protein
VNVKKAGAQGEMTVIGAGAVAEGDTIVKRASDEIRPGAKLR